MNRSVLFTLIVGVISTSQGLNAGTLTNTISLDGDISGFFDDNGLPWTGVDVTNDPAGAITGVPDSSGLGEPPLAPTQTKDGLIHPNGFNARRLISGYNPDVDGGTIYIGIDLPGGSGSAANPDYSDSLQPVRGSIRPFDADGNGEPETIGRRANGDDLTKCFAAHGGDTVDVIACGNSDNASFSDAPDDPVTIEEYCAFVRFGDATSVSVCLIEDWSSRPGHARLQVENEAGKTFGVKASVDAAGVPLGWDVELAITNVNANVCPSVCHNHDILVIIGSSRDGLVNGEDTAELVRNLATTVNEWISPAGGLWQNACNWSLGQSPTNYLSAVVTNSTAKVKIDANTDSSTLAGESLVLAAPLELWNASIPLRLSGTALIDAGGVLILKNSALEVGGDFELRHHAEIAFDLAGHLHITGAARLAGALALQAPSTTSRRSRFVLLDAGSIIGGFSNIASGRRLKTADRTGSFRVTYSGHELVVSNFRRRHHAAGS